MQEIPLENKPIKLLPEHLINQIKAGEVIEKPANILKELLENSIDAASTEISIRVEGNGLDIISIEDNGVGIDFDSLPFAFCRHATSKIQSFEDLYRLDTFGFRGEALPSIASVSRITCSSLPKSGLRGGKLEIHGGEEINHLPLPASDHGTKIFIKDLFFNTPARLKFIKSKTAEKNSILTILNSFVLQHPQVSFTIKLDDNETYFYQKIKPQKLEERIKKIFYQKKSANKEIIHLNGEYDNIHVNGYFSKSSVAGSKKKQFIFINKRYVEDKKLHNTILYSTYSNFWSERQSGHYVLFISTPQADIDVNVHPNKTQIHLKNASTIHSFISSIIKSHAPVSKTESVGHRTSPRRENELELSNLTSEQYDSSSKPPQEKALLALIENKYALVNHCSTYYVLDLKNYLIYLFSDSKRYGINNLLIGQPVILSHNGIKDQLRSFTSFGFEIDLLDNKNAIVRAIPDFFQALDISKFIQDLVFLLEGNLNLEVLTNFITRQWKPEYLKNGADLYHHFIQSNLSHFKELPFLSELNTNSLKNLFKS